MVYSNEITKFKKGPFYKEEGGVEPNRHEVLKHPGAVNIKELLILADLME